MQAKAFGMKLFWWKMVEAPVSSNLTRRGLGRQRLAALALVVAIGRRLLIGIERQCAHNGRNVLKAVPEREAKDE